MDDARMDMPKIIDNVNLCLCDDLAETIAKKSELQIVAESFSIYAYEKLKRNLSGIGNLRFIFTAPTFTAEKSEKSKREFYIPRMTRERNLYGTEFEVRLRNELTQRAIAKECADWIRRKAKFKSNTTEQVVSGFLNVLSEKGEFAYSPFDEFTTVGLGCERGNYVCKYMQKLPSPLSKSYIDLFERLWKDDRFRDVTDRVVENIANVYNENSPEFIYFVALYNIFKEFLENVSEDELPNEATGFKESEIWKKLYNFQRDAVLAIIGKLEKFNGCILADSVGLGKTFTALAVIKYYENRNKSVLVLCPKKLSENWNTYKGNYVNNPIAADRLRYDVLYHTDLSREHGRSNGIELDRLNWGNYDLVVIDESHNFRNGGKPTGDDGKDNRYTTLLKRVIQEGVKTKVLMLSATPVNNKFIDLKNQLKLAYEGDSARFDEKLDTTKGVDEIFRQAQKSFNEWSGLPAEKRSTDALLQRLDFDFFELLDSVTIARSRKHIEKYYDTTAVGKFPERLPPVSLRPRLTDLDAVNYNDIYNLLISLNLTIYTPTNHIMPTKLGKYVDAKNDKRNLTRQGREEGLRRLMSINLLKRLESSVASFRLTVDRIRKLIDDTIETIKNYRSGGCALNLTEISESEDFDYDDQNTDFFSVGRKIGIDLADMDYMSWLRELEEDAEKLKNLSRMIRDITSEHDTKLQTLFELIQKKIEHPVNPGNKKIIIFTAFSDTADYLFENVGKFAKEKFGLETAEITGTVDGKTTIPKLRTDLNTVLTCFSPVSKGKDILLPGNCAELDILIATDCISEGQNLQDCDYLVNYDIHWNPVRIIQRFGRIDRIGSKNGRIQLVNFWPDMDLDEYINLKSRVETKMKIVDVTATGDDNILSSEKNDLEYRKAQLKRLQKEVVDIEEMGGGISIMDLGLNEFRLDLMDYAKRHPDLERSPMGLHAVADALPDCPPGVIYVLKNRERSVDVDKKNRLHPFYMVYVDENGATVCDYLNPKKLLDTMRLLCHGKSVPIENLCKRFNDETDDGRKMGKISELLGKAIESIVGVKEESDIDSLFSAGGTSALKSEVAGLDDFELVCFLVIGD